ncbi:MAG: response regulator [Planctomycetes bacterium]|nr:response regulator [Planctomycetota bacterium]
MSCDAVGRAMEILLVEDDLEDARTTIEALKECDVPCRVSLVRDGDEAMRFLHRDGIFARTPRPDLVLLDMQLPKLDGREVLTQVRADAHLESLPVVVLTASEVHKAVLEGENLRVNGYMTKPVSLEQFISVVRTLRRSGLDDSILPGLG